jgi:hypothetical protein
MESKQKIRKENAVSEIRHIGIAADHGEFELKVQLIKALKAAGYELVDFSPNELVNMEEK